MEALFCGTVPTCRKALCVPQSGKQQHVLRPLSAAFSLIREGGTTITPSLQLREQTQRSLSTFEIWPSTGGGDGAFSKAETMRLLFRSLQFRDCPLSPVLHDDCAQQHSSVFCTTHCFPSYFKPRMLDCSLL